MLNELSMASTKSLASPDNALDEDRTKGFANARAKRIRRAIRKERSNRYFSRRCLIELCVRRSKNISELKGSGVLLCWRSRWSQIGKPTASAPARNQGAKK